MSSPVTEFREGLGLAQSEFARGLGVSLSAVWQAEKGLSQNPRKLWQALQKTGFDPTDLEQRHQTWLSEQRFKRLS